MSRLGKLLAVMIALVAIIACVSDEDVQQQIAESEQSGGPSAISVDATALLAAYDGNRIAADAQYKDRTVLVTGIVDEIDEYLIFGRCLPPIAFHG